MDPEHPELDKAFAELRALPRVRPEARERLRSAIAATPPPHTGGPRRPWSLRVALPLAAAAGLGALLLTTMLSEPAPARAPDTARATNAEAASQPVQFVFVAGQANSVTLVGDFNDWDPEALPLRRGEGGVWSVELRLPAGRFTYSFLVDGREWRADPAAPRVPGDDFGRPSSVLLVHGAET